MRLPVLPGVLALLLLAGAARGEGETGRMLAAAHAQIGVTVRYAPAYVRLDYPGGDVAADRGVCSDVLIRAMRAVGVDLQVESLEFQKTTLSTEFLHATSRKDGANLIDALAASCGPAPRRAVVARELTKLHQEVLRGTLSELAATVRGLGVQRFEMKYSSGPLPHDRLMRSIELYGTRVVPMVRDMLARSSTRSS